MTTSSALVPTDDARSAGQELTSGLTGELSGTWDEEAGSGSIRFGEDGPLARLLARPEGLEVTVEVDEGVQGEGDEGEAGEVELEHVEQLVGTQLAHFWSSEDLVVSWAHEDGTPGSSQGPVDGPGGEPGSRSAPADPSDEYS
ncbi:MAG: hypothetical protein ACTJGR_06500 [Pauljensenia sp.]